MTFSNKLRYSILILYFLLMCILFCLPGSAFPSQSWLGKVAFDKWVHIGLFALFTYLAGWSIPIRKKRGLMVVFLIAVVYGIIVEFVQDRFIPNRSFDLGDWGADIIGSFVGIWWWNLRYIKK
jgi:VanZ family protein